MRFLVKKIIGEYGFFSQYYSVGDIISIETLIKANFVFRPNSAEDVIKVMEDIVVLELAEED